MSDKKKQKKKHLFFIRLHLQVSCSAMFVLFSLCLYHSFAQHLFCFTPVFLMFDHLFSAMFFLYSPSLAYTSFKDNIQVKMCLLQQQSWRYLFFPPCKLKTTLLRNPSCLFLCSQYEDRWGAKGVKQPSLGYLNQWYLGNNPVLCQVNKTQKVSHHQGVIPEPSHDGSKLL